MTGQISYRVGRHVPTNLYRGDEPIGHACDAEDAALIVDAINGANRRLAKLEQHLERARADALFFVDPGAVFCSRCRDTNYDERTLVCLTCTYPDHPMSMPRSER